MAKKVVVICSVWSNLVSETTTGSGKVTETEYKDGLCTTHSSNNDDEESNEAF